MGKTPTQKMLEEIDPSRKEYTFNPKRKFSYDEKDNCPEFSEYVRNIDSGKRNFNCPHLRTFPEDVIIIRKQAPPDRYHKGDNTCLLREEKGISRRCTVKSRLLNRQVGDSAILCEEGYRLIINVKDVEEPEY